MRCFFHSPIPWNMLHYEVPQESTYNVCKSFLSKQLLKSRHVFTFTKCHQATLPCFLIVSISVISANLLIFTYGIIIVPFVSTSPKIFFNDFTKIINYSNHYLVPPNVLFSNLSSGSLLWETENSFGQTSHNTSLLSQLLFPCQSDSVSIFKKQ